MYDTVVSGGFVTTSCNLGVISGMILSTILTTISGTILISAMMYRQHLVRCCHIVADIRYDIIHDIVYTDDMPDIIPDSMKIS